MTTTPPMPPASTAPRPPRPTAAVGGTSPAPSTGARALLELLLRRRTVVLLVVVLMSASVAAGLAFADREYTATAQVAVTPPTGETTSMASYTDLLGTVASVAQSRPLLAEVAARLPGRSAEQLADEVRGDVVTATVIIQISVTDTDARTAAAIADLVAEQLPEFDPTAGQLDYQVTEPAAVPTAPSSPDIPLTAIAGLALTLVLAVAAAAAADRVLRAVSDAADLGQASGAPVLGVVPRPGDPTGVQALDPTSEEFTALRALRVGIEFASAQAPVRVLVVAPASGTDPAAGWLEVNLAATLAEIGHRVLVVDSERHGRDRHPALVHPDGPGLYDVLAGAADLEDAVRPGPVEGVDVLAVGDTGVMGPSLIEMRFGGLLASTEADYDVVIVHAAPVLESDDARTMAIGGALVLTAASGRVHPRHLQEAAERLRMIRVRVIGSVLTGARARRA